MELLIKAIHVQCSTRSVTWRDECSHSLDTDLSRLQYVTYKLHDQALSDIIGTERSSEVWFDSKCDVRSNESLEQSRHREWCDYAMWLDFWLISSWIFSASVFKPAVEWLPYLSDLYFGSNLHVYTTRHLYQCIEEHRASAIGNWALNTWPRSQVPWPV